MRKRSASSKESRPIFDRSERLWPIGETRFGKILVSVVLKTLATSPMLPLFFCHWASEPVFSAWLVLPQGN